MIKDSVTHGKPSCATTKSTLFVIIKAEWNTKEDTGKLMKNALYICQKVPLRTLNSEKIELVPSAIIELH